MRGAMRNGHARDQRIDLPALRAHKGISLREIAESTKISVTGSIEAPACKAVHFNVTWSSMGSRKDITPIAP